MADEGGAQDRALSPVEDIAKKPYDWEFFAAVRALQTMRGTRPAVGRSTRIEQDFLRFKQEPTLAFQASEIIGFDRSPEIAEDAWALRHTFFGMFGPNGPLPLHITEDAIADKNGPKRHRLLPDFCDLLQHRMTSLLYRAWESTQLAASRDLGGDDPYKRFVNALFGQAPKEMYEREALPDDTKRFMSGWLANQHGSAAALESVVEIITGKAARVDQFVGEWLPIPANEQTRFPAPAPRGKRAATPPRLGIDTTLGARAYSLQTRLAIRTVRLDFEEYDALLPDGPIFPMLKDGIRHVIGLSAAWELRPILKVGEIPKLSLDGGRRLGWDTWLDPTNRTRDGDELVIDGTLRAQVSAV